MLPEPFWESPAPDLLALLEGARDREQAELRRLAWLAAKIINHSGWAPRGVSVADLLSEWGIHEGEAS